MPIGLERDAPKINAWWWPAQRADAPAILYLHGARWNLTGQLRRIEQLHKFGFAVFAIDYRGFGKSDGDLPSEETVYVDAMTAWQWLVRQQPDPARKRAANANRPIRLPSIAILHRLGAGAIQIGPAC